MQPLSLFERLGGKAAVTAVVDGFVARCASDDRINAKFARSDIPRLKSMLVDQVCEATGGPCTYTGRDMTETHSGMGVTTGEFEVLVEESCRHVERAQRPPVGARRATGSARADEGRHRRGRFARDRVTPPRDV